MFYLIHIKHIFLYLVYFLCYFDEDNHIVLLNEVFLLVHHLEYLSMPRKKQFAQICLK